MVIHAPTGSGKTLAYLVPILSRLEPRVPFQLLFSSFWSQMRIEPGTLGAVVSRSNPLVKRADRMLSGVPLFPY